MFKHEASNSTLIHANMFRRNDDAQYGLGARYGANPLQSAVWLRGCEWLCVLTYHQELNLLVGDITSSCSSVLWRSEESASETRRQVRQSLSMNHRNILSSQHREGEREREWERSYLPNEYCRRIYWLKLLINLLNSMHDRNFERREPMCIGNFGLTPTKSWGTIQQRKENEMGNLHKDEWGSPLVEFWFEQIGGECTPAHCGSIRAPGFQLFLILVSEHISNNNDNCSNCAQNWLTIDQGAKYYAYRLQSTIYLCGCEWHRVLTYQLEQNMLVERYHVQLNTSKTTQDRFDPYIPSYRQGRRGGRFDRVYIWIMGTFCQSRTGSYFDLYILTNYKQLSTITFPSGSKSQAMKSCLL